jgi:hypothetical protein
LRRFEKSLTNRREKSAKDADWDLQILQVGPGVPPGTGSPNDDGASVHLEITGPGSATIPISYLIRPFRSLDEAVEEARKRLLAFAQELVSQAENPLLRTPENP